MAVTRDEVLRKVLFTCDLDNETSLDENFTLEDYNISESGLDDIVTELEDAYCIVLDEVRLDTTIGELVDGLMEQLS
jgi:hypothetical protein